MTQLGFNLLGHPNVGKGKVLDFSTLKTQMFRVSEICGIYFAKGHNTNDLWFRIRGGNGSQKFGLEIWTDEMIEAWATDQKYHGFKVIYTVNYNDVNDYEVYQKIASKINIHAIEMGNEQYLPKYFPIVHSSPLNFRWQKRNPWFVESVVPKLRITISELL